jgi:hypothetical protein
MFIQFPRGLENDIAAEIRIFMEIKLGGDYAFSIGASPPHQERSGARKKGKEKSDDHRKISVPAGMPETVITRTFEAPPSFYFGRLRIPT